MDLLTAPIASFTGPYDFLSNFYPSTVNIIHGATVLPMPTVEHAFQASKMVRWVDAVEIQNAERPGKAKRLGRTLQIRPDWDSVKLEVMFGLLCEKFSDPELGKKLLATGERLLIEGNTWNDRFWGAVWENNDFHGANWLGQLLMRIRKDVIS